MNLFSVLILAEGLIFIFYMYFEGNIEVIVNPIAGGSSSV